MDPDFKAERDDEQREFFPDVIPYENGVVVFPFGADVFASQCGADVIEITHDGVLLVACVNGGEWWCPIAGQVEGETTTEGNVVSMPPSKRVQ